MKTITSIFSLAFWRGIVQNFLDAIGAGKSILSRELWRSVWALTRPFFYSKEKWAYKVPWTSKEVLIEARYYAWTLCTLLVLFLVAVSQMNAMINGFFGAFQNALPGALTDAHQVSVAWDNLRILAWIFVFAGPVIALYRWLKERFAIAFRRWLTESMLVQYFANRNYYRISQNSLVENPDERIASDIEGFVAGAVGIVVAALDSVITILFFTQILWGLSPSLTAVAALYASLGTLIAIWLSVKLISLKYAQVRLEADYRYGLINVRNNVEQIAFYQGEQAEWKQLIGRFHAALTNNLSLIGYQRKVNLFTNWFDKFVTILPFAVVMPLYLEHHLKIGAFSQASMAFAQVLGALSIFVEQIGATSAFAAYVNRLTGLKAAFNQKDLWEQEGYTAIETVIADRIAMNSVTVMSPDNALTLAEGLSFVVAPGTGLVIKGPSGAGKTTLLRALAGLNRLGLGMIYRPELLELLFLSQKPYMSLGTLREQLLYPHVHRDVSDAQLLEAMRQANIDYLVKRYPSGLDGYPGEGKDDSGQSVTFRPWSEVLSPGEQQRLAFARLLLAKPKYVFLDEATSALDTENEALLYRTLKTIGATYVSVGHRPTLDAYHEQTLTLAGDGTWSLAAA